MTAEWPRAAGEMADRIRAHDWRATLGPLQAWPAPLRTAVELMLEARHPVYVGWGKDLVSLYNDAAISILGSKHPWGLGLPYRVLFAEIWDEFTPLVTATLRGESSCFEDRSVALASRGASPSWFTFSFTPLRDEKGAVAGLFCSAFETTRKVQAAQAARRASESRYRTLFNSIDEGFCVIEMAFDEQGNATDYRFVETNPAFEQQTGLTSAVGKWMRELSPMHEQHWFDVYGRVALTGKSTRFVEHARALGRWYNVFAFRTGQPSEHLVALLFSDITERVEAENALRAADRRKDEFLATLAHELRNPLAPLRNAVQLFRKSLDPTAALQGTVALMDRQLTHLVRLVDDLLDVGRISSGKIELKRAPVRLSDVIAGSIEASRACIEERGHQFHVEGDAGNLTVIGDLHRLSQVLTNLLSNACKYTHPGGRIRVTVMRQGGDAVIRVMDNGIGIPGPDTGRVFELFSQVRAHQPLHAGGLGIGLSLVRSLVALHGGTVEAFSDGAGRGSTFTVRLPLVAQQKLADSAPDQPRLGRMSRRVLVADDNSDAAATLAELLRLQGHEVWTASDGVEAVTQASAKHPDAILMDLGMPHMDGIEAARRIRALPEGKQPLLVALTGWGQVADRDRTQDAGFDFHLVKPADPDEILGLIEKAGVSRAESPPA
jgi:PAS domain S-box-containing protein